MKYQIYICNDNSMKCYPKKLNYEPVVFNTVEEAKEFIKNKNELTIKEIK